MATMASLWAALVAHGHHEYLEMWTTEKWATSSTLSGVFMLGVSTSCKCRVECRLL